MAGERFEEIVRKYSEPLYWHIRGIVSSHDDADDVLQEVFIKVWRKMDSFRGESDIFTWLWRIATNEALSFLRKRRVRAAFGIDALEIGRASSQAYDESPDAGRVNAALARAVSELPPKQRSVFVMRYFEDLSYEQISNITHTSVGALKASYHLACERLKTKLSDEE
ncbi:MAG: RNA polymerase sigma factor [Bacteroidales bacterium]|nr:RNA polymerase sigma factor [Bacteroidales bacterium]